MTNHFQPFLEKIYFYDLNEYKNMNTTIESHRNHLEIKQEAQYFDLGELSKQTGQPVDKFGDVILKELIDNALDACETAGVVPEIGIYTAINDEQIAVMITDNANVPQRLLRRCSILAVAPAIKLLTNHQHAAHKAMR